MKFHLKLVDRNKNKNNKTKNYSPKIKSLTRVRMKRNPETILLMKCSKIKRRYNLIKVI